MVPNKSNYYLSLFIWYGPVFIRLVSVPSSILEFFPLILFGNNEDAFPSLSRMTPLDSGMKFFLLVIRWANSSLSSSHLSLFELRFSNHTSASGMTWTNAS